MYSSREEWIKIWDEQRKQVTSMKIGEVEDQLDRLKRLVEKVLEKLTLEDYQLANYKFKS